MEIKYCHKCKFQKGYMIIHARDYVCIRHMKKHIDPISGVTEKYPVYDCERRKLNE